MIKLANTMFAEYLEPATSAGSFLIAGALAPVFWVKSEVRVLQWGHSLVADMMWRVRESTSLSIGLMTSGLDGVRRKIWNQNFSAGEKTTDILDSRETVTWSP